MFSIIISEKGGAERRESFDKNEINVGRVQGNDLMLPKGNVSKHHARLLFRDGRFIVTDLKSTNGTYVNGRKIAQATIVREGDKIYIGDFVIRLATQATGPAEQPPAEDESIRTVSREQAAARAAGGQQPAVTMKAQTAPPNQPLQRPPEKFQIDDIEDSEPAHKARPHAQPAAAPEATPAPHAAPRPVGMPPLPLDGGSPPGASNSSMPAPVISATRAAAPGRVVQATMPLQPVPGAARPGGPIAPPPIPPAAMPVPTPQPSPSPAAPPPAQDRVIAPPVAERVIAPPPQDRVIAPPVAERVIAPPPQDRAIAPPAHERVIAPPVADRVKAPPVAARPLGQSSPPPPLAPPPVVQAPPPKKAASPPEPTPPPAHVAGRHSALVALVARIAETVDLSPLGEAMVVADDLAQEIERAARDQAEALRSEGQIPDDVDPEALVTDAVNELVHVGPLGALLDDPEVTEVHYACHDQATVVRGGVARPEAIGVSSDDALFRIIGRLAHQSGDAWRSSEIVVERRHPKGSVVAILPPAAPVSTLTVRKPSRVEGTLEDLARAQAIGRPMVTFLEACVAGRVNVLVAGSGATGLVGALANAAAAGDRVAVVSDVEDVIVPHAHVTQVTMVDARERGRDAVRGAARLHADRLVVTRLTGLGAAAVVEAVADGASGVLAASQAPSLRQATARLASQLVLSGGGISIDSARDAVAEAFDIAIECTRGADGRDRVQRIAEVVGTDPKGVVLKDIFTCDDTGFTATGIVPKIAAELGQRGVKVDGGVFKRR